MKTDFAKAILAYLKDMDSSVLKEREKFYSLIDNLPETYEKQKQFLRKYSDGTWTGICRRAGSREGESFEDITWEASEYLTQVKGADPRKAEYVSRALVLAVAARSRNITIEDVAFDRIPISSEPTEDRGYYEMGMNTVAESEIYEDYPEMYDGEYSDRGWFSRLIGSPLLVVGIMMVVLMAGLGTSFAMDFIGPKGENTASEPSKSERVLEANADTDQAQKPQDDPKMTERTAPATAARSGNYQSACGADPSCAGAPAATPSAANGNKPACGGTLSAASDDKPTYGGTSSGANDNNPTGGKTGQDGNARSSDKTVPNDGNSKGGNADGGQEPNDNESANDAPPDKDFRTGSGKNRADDSDEVEDLEDFDEDVDDEWDEDEWDDDEWNDEEDTDESEDEVTDGEWDDDEDLDEDSDEDWIELEDPEDEWDENIDEEPFDDADMSTEEFGEDDGSWLGGSMLGIVGKIKSFFSNLIK